MKRPTYLPGDEYLVLFGRVRFVRGHVVRQCRVEGFRRERYCFGIGSGVTGGNHTAIAGYTAELADLWAVTPFSTTDLTPMAARLDRLVAEYSSRRRAVQLVPVTL